MDRRVALLINTNNSDMQKEKIHIMKQAKFVLKCFETKPHFLQ